MRTRLWYTGLLVSGTVILTIGIAEVMAQRGGRGSGGGSSGSRGSVGGSSRGSSAPSGGGRSFSGGSRGSVSPGGSMSRPSFGSGSGNGTAIGRPGSPGSTIGRPSVGSGGSGVVSPGSSGLVRSPSRGPSVGSIPGGIPGRSGSEDVRGTLPRPRPDAGGQAGPSGTPGRPPRGTMPGRDGGGHPGGDRDHDWDGGHHQHSNWWLGLGWGGYWGWDPYRYSWWRPGYYGSYYPDYSYYPYSSTDTVPYTTGMAATELYPPAPPVAATESDTGQEWFQGAVEAFGQGHYPEAARLAAHATVDRPQDAKVHEVASLALLANGDFQGASMEAHAALALGPPADWQTLYSYYNDLPTYQGHLAALEKALRDNPNSVDARFVLGYHDLMMGHVNEAREQFEYVAKQSPQDRVAQKVLERLRGAAGTAVQPPAP